jgi:hypothetical protein
MITNKSFLAALACIFLAIAAASELRADGPETLITGGPSFFGGASASGPDCDGCRVDLSFSNNWVFLSGSGTYAGIPQTSATFTNFSFIREGPNVTLINPVPMFWSFTFGGNNYSFDLMALSNAHVQSGDLTMTGSGVLHATGFDPTPGNFGVTGSGTNFVYQVTFVGGAVPEPTPLALAGLGLAISGGIAYFRRGKG